jgi:hypothetical protein
MDLPSSNLLKRLIIGLIARYLVIKRFTNESKAIFHCV